MRRLANSESVLRWAERCLWLAAFLALGYWVFVFLDARIYQASESGRLDRALQQESSAQPGPGTQSAPAAAPSLVPPETQPRSLIGRLKIPRIGLSAMVLEGNDERTLQLGVGHLHGTALPGMPGNVVLAAHRDTFFRPLRNIREGDRITITTTHGIHDYWVQSTAVVDPDDTQALRASLRPTLTLVTCYPFSYVGTAPKRFVVQAHEGEGSWPPRAEPAAGHWQYAAGRGISQPQHTTVAASEPEANPAADTQNARAAAGAAEADTVETAADQDLPRPSHRIKRIPGRFFGKLAGIVRRRDKRTTEAKGAS